MICFCKNEMVKKEINGVSYMECPSCGYLRKMTELTDFEEKKRYDLHVVDQGYVKYMEGVYQKISRYVKGRCLDYGCGQIHILADILRKEGLDSFYYDLYYYQDMPGGMFDTIILIEVFEHVADVASLMEKLRGMLDAEGAIIIMTQVKKYPLEKWWYLRDITHRSFVDPLSMDALAEASGFSVIHEDGYFVLRRK